MVPPRDARDGCDLPRVGTSADRLIPGGVWVLVGSPVFKTGEAE